jgi:GcrA cell cycle regulator
MTGGTWTNEALAILRRMHTAGAPFSAIAEAIGGGMSRNAVIGKATRLGITGDRRVTAYNWTPEQIDRLRLLHAEGHTAADIAKTIGASESTVGKKLRALHLARGRWPKGPTKVRTSPPKSKLLPPTPPEPPRAPDCEPVTLLQLEFHHCRFPIGEVKGPDTLFCGDAKKVGSYCRYHNAIVTGEGTYSERRAVDQAEKAAA